jgi:methyl-accepting chemotaxis protein
VVVEAAVLIFLARIMRRAAAQAAELEAMVTALAATTGRIDLTPLPVTPRSRLGNSLRDMIAAIRETLGGVQAGTDTIAGASGEIAHGSAELSQRTVRQAASIEQTVAAMVQLAATVRRNNDNARAANTLAQSASDIAGRGGAAVREVVATMGGISASSRQIADIIGVIDGIAFQTNILALNAAVEAARAGEQGRGFAVVASEVRNLAQRSAAAAREIKALISDSVTRVETGSGLVNDAGAIIVQVVDSVQRVTAIMAEMSNAAVEQNEGIERINHALVAIDEATQQNATLAQQDLEAAQALAGEVQHLTTLVAAFKLGDGGARPAPVQLR